jgi:hypothetical protein
MAKPSTWSLPAAKQLNGFSSLDFPDAVLVGEGRELTAWENQAAQLAGGQPVAVVKAIGFQPIGQGKCSTAAPAPSG